MSALDERRLRGLRALGGTPALLVVDVQRSFGDPAYLESYHLGEQALFEIRRAIDSCRRLVEAARAHGVPVYWIELGTDAEVRWNSSHWLRTGDPDAQPGPDEPCVVGTPGAQWFELEPAADEPRIRKRVYSGFIGTDLESRLHAGGVTSVAVVGLTTECCVFSTANDAMQLGWPVIVPSDASAAYTPELHVNALEMLALNVAMITTAARLEEFWKTRGDAS